MFKKTHETGKVTFAEKDYPPPEEAADVLDAFIVNFEESQKQMSKVDKLPEKLEIYVTSINSDYDLCWMPLDVKPADVKFEKNKIYLEVDGGYIAYSVIPPREDKPVRVKTQIPVSENFKTTPEEKFTPEDKSIILKETSRNGHTYSASLTFQIESKYLTGNHIPMFGNVLPQFLKNLGFECNEHPFHNEKESLYYYTARADLACFQKLASYNTLLQTEFQKVRDAVGPKPRSFGSHF